MRKVSRLIAILSLIAVGPFTRAEEPRDLEGLKVGGYGMVGMNGGGGGVSASFGQDSWFVEASGGALSPFEGSDSRLIGNLSGLYCFRENFGLGLCLGGKDFLRSNGHIAEIGVSPIGFGYYNRETGGSLFLGPRYAVIRDYAHELDTNLVGIDLTTDVPISDAVDVLTFVNLGYTFFPASYVEGDPLESRGSSMYVNAGVGFDVKITDNLNVDFKATFQDNSFGTAPRTGESTSGISVIGDAGATWAF
jgi:hypothetical protein